MTTYLALLRGINVGSANRIRMEELRRLFEQSGCSRVETYIQSGNVFFDASEPENEIVCKTETALLEQAGIHTNVVLRSLDELRRTVSRLPFTEEEIATVSAKNTEGESLYVYFAAHPPAPEVLEKRIGQPSAEDRFRMIERDAYLLLSQSIRSSKLAIRMQSALAPVTARNWNTVLQLFERMNAR